MVFSCGFCLPLKWPQVWTALTGLGYPTDVVSFGTDVVVCDALNHVLWVYSGATEAVLASKQPWSLGGLRVLTGAHGGGMQGQYAEGGPDTAMFWEPMGIAYDEGRHVLYVSDYRNRAIRMVDPDTGDTALFFGNPDVPAAYVDSNVTADVRLTGPTALVYSAAEDALYFTDRRVATDPNQVFCTHTHACCCVRFWCMCVCVCF